MNRAAKLPSALLLAAVLTLGCGAGQSPEPTKVSSSAAQDGADAVAREGEVATANGPKITADEAVHEFGGIKASDSIEHVFTIRNAGDADLKIERVKKT